MSRVAVVTTAETPDVDATNALLATVESNWPEAHAKVLTSARLHQIPAHWNAISVEEVHGTSFLISRILRESDQIALGLPKLLDQLLEEYDTCVYIGLGLLVVRRPTELITSAQHLGTSVVVPASTTPAYSLTPSLGSIETGPHLPETRVLAVTAASRHMLKEWSVTVTEAVLGIDQRPVHWAFETFLERSIARSDVEVEGRHTFLHWSDYAAVEAGRARGPNAAIIACDELFASAREVSMSDDPEVAWSLLVHRVHDSRPVEPFLRLIESKQPMRTPIQAETFFDLLKTDVWRSADPFGRRWDIDDDDEFTSWLFEANESGAPRIAHLLTISNPELLKRFHSLRFDPSSFRAWVEERGRIELGFDPFDRDYEPREGEAVEEPRVHPTLNALRWRWNTLKTLIPGHTQRATRHAERAYLGSDPGEKRGLAPPQHIPVHRRTPMWGTSPRGLNLIGPFRSESGLGQAARASLEAIRLLGRPFSHIDTTENYPSRNADEVGLNYSTYGQIGEVNLIHSNADEMITMGPGAFKHRFGGRFNAAMWFWETADLPLRSRPALNLVDELWVASEYQRDVFGQYARVPVHVVGLAAELPERREVDRSDFGWAADELVFLFVYDALSSYGRKNPRKAIDAFIGAFRPNFKDVRFVLKVSNLNKFPASQKEILGLADQYPAITVIDEYLTREDVMSLMAAADVYVSLHAAEGLGLTLLEAMAVGTPVICTGYSGNMDFTTSENSWLVGYDMMRRADGSVSGRLGVGLTTGGRCG